jgi:hypothetical protein
MPGSPVFVLQARHDGRIVFLFRRMILPVIDGCCMSTRNHLSGIQAASAGGRILRLAARCLRLRPTFAVIVALGTLAAASAAADGLFPALEGWKQGEIKRYSPENLYMPIDGAADLFLRYNFEEMQSVGYQNGPDAFSVEAYRHATLLDAFGIYSQGRPSMDVYLPLGVQGYAGVDYLNFLAGRYYVEMRTSKPGPKTQAAMRTVAATMAGALNQGATMPSLFACFPAQGRKPNSEKYLARDILGYAFLNHAFQVEYDVDGKSCTLLAMRGLSESEPAAMLQAYCTELQQTAGVVGGGCVVLEDKYQGRVLLWPTGRYLLCLTGDVAPADGRALLAELKSRIETAKE